MVLPLQVTDSFFLRTFSVLLESVSFELQFLRLNETLFLICSLLHFFFWLTEYKSFLS